MKITLVTTWDTACGIAEHSFYLKDALEQLGVAVEVEADLHPAAVLATALVRDRGQWLILNYHAALHSQWTPDHVRLAQASGLKVLIIYHDSGVPNSDQCKDLYRAADAFVVHEPVGDLPGAIFLRQGVPTLPNRHPYIPHRFKAYDAQPVVGSIGFPFPWKNYDLLAEASALAGWALLLIAPGATPEQVAGWQARNPNTLVVTGFQERTEMLALLHYCDATAFLYTCVNTGTSGAIRQGIAARKPVLASHPDVCRQWRDLARDPVGNKAIRWLQDLSPAGVADALSAVPITRVDTRVVRLAAQDAWEHYGRACAELLRR